MQTVIIAGGKGTRLGLKDIPKPMAKIDGLPLLEHQILLAKKYGCFEFFILSGYKSEIIKDYFKNGERLNVKIHHIEEPYPLGTAGALGALKGKIKDRFMVFYGDVVMDFDINSFIEFDKKYNSIATLVVHPNDHPYDSDLLEVDKDNKVVSFFLKPHDEKRYYQNLTNAAVYIFSPDIFNFIEPDKKQDIARDVLTKLVGKQDLRAYRTSEYIKDMGTNERFEKTAGDFISKKVKRLNKINKRRCIFLDRDGVINKDNSLPPPLLSERF